MDKKLQVVQAKELRSEIIERLYDFYGEEIAVSTIKTLLRYNKNYYSDKDIKRALCYLSGEEKAYIYIKANLDDYWDSLVQLTPLGINLAEGDIKDMGVLSDE